MNKKLFIFLCSVFVSFSVSANQTEIDHLLSFVKLTECQYERNGTKYNGEKAVKHIRKKYNYYSDDIKTAEDFIRYSATKSSMSGKAYKIHCEGKYAVTSQQWLLGELHRLRQFENVKNTK